MKSVIFRPEARRDALEAFWWYERQRAGLGAAFRDELERTVARIRENPKAYAVLWRETRRARLRRFPYAVFYREYADALVVVAVLHGRRDPNAWRRRVT